MLYFGEQGFQLLEHFEGFYETAYQDVAGIWTIGYGTIRVNGKPVEEGMTCTIEEAKEWVLAEMRQVQATVRSVARLDRPFTQYEFDALCDLTYNIGSNGFLWSIIAKKIRSAPDGIDTVTEENFTAWNKATIDGVLKPVAGLTRRRKSEWYLFKNNEVKFHF